MEYKFLDSKLPVDLTNLIASFVGPKNKAHINEINSMYNGLISDVWEEKYVELEEFHDHFDIGGTSREVDRWINKSDNYIIGRFQNLKLKHYYQPGFWDDVFGPDNNSSDRDSNYDSDSDAE